MSVSKNDITGDSIASRASTQQYRDNYDRIFGNKKINNSGVSGEFVPRVDEDGTVKTTTLREWLDKNPPSPFIHADGSSCNHEQSDDEIAFLKEAVEPLDAEKICQEFIKLPDSRTVMQKWLERGPTTSEMESMPVISPEQDITDAATRYKSMRTLEELSSIPATTFRRKDGSLSYHEEPSDEIPFLQQSDPTSNAGDWFKKILAESSPPPFIPSSDNPVSTADTVTSKSDITSRPIDSSSVTYVDYDRLYGLGSDLNSISIPDLKTAEEYEKAVHYGIIIPGKKDTSTEIDDEPDFVQTSSSKSSIDNRSEPSYCSYVSDQNIPLVYVGPLLDTPIITVENYCKWYSLFAVMPDGKVRKITPEEIEEATDDFSNAWHIDHNFHPLLLNKLAEMFKGEVCSQSLEMVAGRWVMEQMGDPFKFIDPTKYEL